MNKTYLSLCLALALSHTSCLEDEGNYDYTELDAVELDGLLDSYRFILQEPVNISPSVKTGIPQDRLEYCWRVGADTLARTKDLAYTFTRIPTSSKNITFEARDVLTDVRYFKEMPLSVVSPFYTGWLILTDDNGKSVLDFQSYEAGNNLYHNLYKEVNGDDMTGRPVMVKQFYYYDSSAGSYADRIVIVNNDGPSPMLDGVSMLRIIDMEDQFDGDTELPVANINAEYFSTLKTTTIITNQGEAYGNNIGSMGSPENGHFQYPYPSDEKGYRLSPFMVNPSNTSYLFCFDEKNNRFVYFISQYISSTISPVVWNLETSIPGVNIDHIDGYPVWMGAYKYSMDIYAVMKTDAGHTLYKFTVSWDGISTLKACVKLPAGMIDDRSLFQVHPTAPYIFITTGNKLMALNLDNINNINDAFNDIATYDGDITAMHYAYDNNKQINELAITVQKSSGESSLLIIDSQLTAHGQILRQYDGIKGKVVSICRKIM